MKKKSTRLRKEWHAFVLRLPPKLNDSIELISFKMGISKNAWINIALKKELSWQTKQLKQKEASLTKEPKQDDFYDEYFKTEEEIDQEWNDLQDFFKE